MSARMRLTLWVTLMVALLSAFVLTAVLVLNRHSLPEDPASYLTSVVLDNAEDVEFDRGRMEWDDLTVYRRGVYCSFYNDEGELLLAADRENTEFAEIPFEANVIRTVMSGDREYYLYDVYVNMTVSGLWIRGVTRTDSSIGITEIILKLTVIILPVILILTFLGAYWISGRTFRPVRRIVETANSINDADDLTDRIGMKRGPKEMKQLADAFDTMFARLEGLFESERQFTSDASHELRTPVAVILAECERAESKKLTKEEYSETIARIEEQGRRMSQLIEELLGLTRMGQGTEKYPLTESDLSEFISMCVEEYIPENDRGISLETDIDSGITAAFNASLISRAVFNFLQNAYKYGRDGGYITVSLRERNGMAELAVADDGIGIAEADLSRIWNRFWQADPSRGAESGSGLGLAMVKGIAELHKGNAEAVSREGEGSTFFLRIPSAAAETDSSC